MSFELCEDVAYSITIGDPPLILSSGFHLNILNDAQ